MSVDRVKEFRDSFRTFAYSAPLLVDGVVRQLGDVASSFQREWVDTMAPAAEALVNGTKPPTTRVWVEAIKGHGKSMLIGILILYVTAFMRRRGLIQLAAADQKQAANPRDAAQLILDEWEWLAKRVTINNWQVVCKATGTVADILAADTSGAPGANPDLLVVDEYACVFREGYVEHLLHNTAKRPDAIALISTNAGQIDTPQFRLREHARTSDNWRFLQCVERPPQMSQATFDEHAVIDRGPRFDSLFLGIWSTGVGTALDPDDIAKCTNPEARPLRGDERGFDYWVAGLDLGVSRDPSALVVLGVRCAERRIVLAHCESWRPMADGKVDLKAVRTGILQAAWQFHPFGGCKFDPYECRYMAQELHDDHGINMVPMPFTAANCDIMACTLLQTFRSRSIELYNHGQLIRDLGRLNIVQKQTGSYKLDAMRNKEGHADLGIGLALAVCAAEDCIARWVPPLPDDGVKQLFDRLMEPYRGNDPFDTIMSG